MSAARQDIQLDDRLVNLTRAADVLGVHVDTLRRHAKSGLLETVQIGGTSGHRYLRASYLRELLHGGDN